MENRLSSILTNGTHTMSFAYDVDGRRVKTTRADGTIVYTPFPDYEVEDPPTGSNIVRTTYRLTGQIVAVQTKVGTAAGTFYFTYTDHLGNITALSTTGGAYVTGSNARYDPFGTFTTTTPTSNPSISNHGFTGHRHNNTGANDLDLIYMNARYYMPLVGRFISPDTIVPNPSNPQSFNRYSYIENRPLNGTDPSGHCIVAYSGDVRMNDGPYGTSGLCLNTESPITEGNAAIEAYYADPSTKSSVGEMIFWYFGAPVILAGVAEVGAAVVPVLTGLCSDGNCTNEVQSVWELNPLKRGIAIEEMLGRSPQLVRNFPVIDRFSNGVATSIKSIDVTAPTYQNLSTLSNTIQRYVLKLANWQGVPGGWGGVAIDAAEIKLRELLVAIPNGITEAQMNVFQSLQEWAITKGVNLSTVVIP